MGSSRKRAATAEAGALLGASPRGLLGQPPGPAPKRMGFPRRVTGLPLAMPQAWYGAQPVCFNRSWAPGPSEGESSERGLMGTEPVQTVYVGAGGWDRGLGRGCWDGLVVLVLGAVFEDAGELHVVEVAFLINGRLSVHLVHLLICEAVSHGGEQLPKVVLMDETWGETGRWGGAWPGP